MESKNPRWIYRFDNYQRAYHLLSEAIEKNNREELDQLAKEGTIQRFEYCMELAWKTLKDYLESENFVLEQVTPRAIIKESFAAKIISHAELWLEALDARNAMSHTYNLAEFEKVLSAISQNYLKCFRELYEKLNKKLKALSDD